MATIGPVRSKRELLAAFLGAAIATPAFAQSVPDETDRPNPVVALPMIEASIRGLLKDPESARFTWPNGFVWGSYKPFMGRRAYGWITCGTVNAKNSFGGYAGRAAAIAVWRYNAVFAVDLDQPEGAGVERACRKLGVILPG